MCVTDHGVTTACDYLLRRNILCGKTYSHPRVLPAESGRTDLRDGRVGGAKAFTKAIPTADVPEGGVASATVNDRLIAILNRGGTFYALDGVCPHEGGHLGEGTIEGDELVCPWHEGRFRLESGEASPDTDWVRDIPSFPVKVEGGCVWVDL